jgi:hypothetical protein
VLDIIPSAPSCSVIEVTGLLVSTHKAWGDLYRIGGSSSKAAVIEGIVNGTYSGPIARRVCSGWC